MKIFDKIMDVFFPENFTCDICGIEIFNGDNLCEKCRGTVTVNNKFTCPVCGRKTLSLQLCLECKAQPPLYDKAVSPLVYSGGAQKLIGKFKHDQPYLKKYLARLIYAKCGSLKDAEAVCYVPMTRAAERNRGYNQSYLLARELSKKLKLPLLKNAVKKIKKSASQKSLTKKERAENLKSCFKADKSAVEGKTLILVDDVLTTGATADAVSGELKKRGAKKVYLVTVASVEYNGEV
ncbi:MAG: double zinc ribbon domain-containing protein [Clostridia bacterium]|nr:double zinc ribbon domain-containing protein [Clostridia bacterium]